MTEAARTLLDPATRALVEKMARLDEPLGPFQSFGERMDEQLEIVASLTAEDIPRLFSLIGFKPPREWRIPDWDCPLDSYCSYFLADVSARHLGVFLDSLRSNVRSLPSVFPVLDASEDLPADVKRAVCECVAGNRCLTPEERGQLRTLTDSLNIPYPFSAFDPAWRTDTVVAIARQMYDAREFGAMPILADALQDAGCEDEQVLNHCRDATAPHVRGCWVCDLVLGKV